MRELLFHLFDDLRADVDVDYIMVALLVHLLRKLTVSATNHKYFVSFSHAILSKRIA